MSAFSPSFIVQFHLIPEQVASPLEPIEAGIREIETARVWITEQGVVYEREGNQPWILPPQVG